PSDRDNERLRLARAAHARRGRVTHTMQQTGGPHIASAAALVNRPCLIIYGRYSVHPF
ncbi:hypothetical protein TorRG33x02_290200, partial [Trema orientale]